MTMLDMAKINKIKGTKQTRKAKEEIYKYAVSLGLQDGIKLTFSTDKIIEIMQRNDIMINSDDPLTRQALLSPEIRQELESYSTDINDSIPEFISRLKELEKTGDDDKIEEEKLLQEIATKRNIPSASPIGKNPPYIIIPYWVYDYIIENSSTWYKKIPVGIKDPKSYELLLSLIYYIRKDGAVTVRESRFSAFHTFIKG